MKNQANKAVVEFEEHSLNEFGEWYTPQVVEYLTHLNTQGEFLGYVFFDRNPGDIQSQFESLKGTKCNKEELAYTEIDIQKILPDKLCEILNCDPQVYKGKIGEIRTLHQNILSGHPSLKNLTISQQNKFLENNCTNHPMQVVVKKHLQDGGIPDNETINAYLQQEDNMKQTHQPSQTSTFDSIFQVVHTKLISPLRTRLLIVYW